ncbi:GNAT family N-acetyltransferase [Nocardioides sp. URHA0020]|uniref:GNAT family N-acetyltransferase n=1 Tax=Nocardioides sp. URHA0020 TaxID=1380392 RepID=UPI0005645A4E|nr:GNAT family protein [Nocardioides sp. URHA0020]
MTPGRVRIVQLPAEAIIALADGDLAGANAASPVPLSAWMVSERSVSTWRYRAVQAVETPADLPWITGVLWDDEAEVAVGQSGFHAAPDVDGMVEVGYGVDPAYRRRGYARAALEIAIMRAQDDPDVRTLRATISPDNEASLALIRQYPFVHNGEQWDEEDGLELIYELPV